MLSRISRASMVLASAGAVTAALLAPAATASADTVIPLRDAVKTAKIGSGGSITVTVKGQSAKLSPGMVSLPTTRNAWVSGNIAVKVDGEADGGSIEAGYVVGCQVEIGTASIDLGGGETGFDSGATFDSTASNPIAISPTVSGSTGASLKLGTGTIGTQSLTFDRATWPKPGDEVAPDWASPSNSYDFTGASGSFNYADQTIGVDGCGGYAQARLYVIAEATVGNSAGKVILWGDKFTLG